MPKKKEEPAEISYSELSDAAKKFIGDTTDFESDHRQKMVEKEEQTRFSGISSAIAQLLEGTMINNVLLKLLTDYYDRALENTILSKDELARHADKALASATSIKWSMEVIDKAIGDGVIYFSLHSEKRCLSARELFESYDAQKGLHFCSAVLVKTGDILSTMYYAHFFYINPISADVIADTNQAQLNDFAWAEFYSLLPNLFKGGV